MQRTDINIDLRIRSRQTGKTTELVSKYFELLTQGKKPCFITVNLNSTKDNIINKMKSINNLENYNDKILNYESINITQFDSFILDDFKYAKNKALKKIINHALETNKAVFGLSSMKILDNYMFKRLSANV